MTMGKMQKTVKLSVMMSQDLWPYQVIDEIQKVMEQGERDGKEGWEKQTISFHLDKAFDHLAEVRETADLGVGKSEDHLAHAFTRLMMAMALECGYMDDPNDEFVKAGRGQEELIRTGRKVIRPERKEGMKRAGTWKGDTDA